jgi:hypothetical protein
MLDTWQDRAASTIMKNRSMVATPVQLCTWKWINFNATFVFLLQGLTPCCGMKYPYNPSFDQPGVRYEETALSANSGVCIDQRLISGFGAHGGVDRSANHQLLQSLS